MYGFIRCSTKFNAESCKSDAWHAFQRTMYKSAPPQLVYTLTVSVSNGYRTWAAAPIIAFQLTFALTSSEQSMYSLLHWNKAYRHVLVELPVTISSIHVHCRALGINWSLFAIWSAQFRMDPFSLSSEVFPFYKGSISIANSAFGVSFLIPSMILQLFWSTMKQH